MIDDSDGELYEKYADELIRFASGVVGPSDAADVLSSAVIRAFTSPSWSRVVNHRAYLYRAVLNEARMWRRSQGRRLARDDRHARPSERTGSSASDHESTSVRAAVRAAVAGLDVRARASCSCRTGPI
jgi:DNA-directed RNA polymerase specialized sigma24 family protein